jgi:uncharacterized protein with HEPN domain
MSKKKFKGSAIYLKEMVDSCRKIKKYYQETTFKEFDKMEVFYDAICMQFLQLGEKVAKLEKADDNIIKKFPDAIDWAGLYGLSNKIDHGYLDVSPEKIWEFIKGISEVEKNLLIILKKRFGIDY